MMEITPVKRSRVYRIFFNKYLFEIITVFLGVTVAFLLNNWREDVKSRQTEIKILKEIKNGLALDLKDIADNIKGHQAGMNATAFFAKLVKGVAVPQDSAMYHTFMLTRDFVSLQNVAGYESLKSKGLDLIQNDSLRYQIVNIYEYSFQMIRKLEEEYAELALMEQYHPVFMEHFAPYMILDTKTNQVLGYKPLKGLSPAQKNTLIYLLVRLYFNHNFVMSEYNKVEDTIKKTIVLIDKDILQG
jgi:hypothetical protein